MGTSKSSEQNREEILEAMSRPEFYPDPVKEVITRQTHISMVFLAGDYVYKVKKEVEMGFLDFSTLEKRKHYCEKEVSLNRRLARDVYLEVVPITRKDGRLFLDGEGEMVEHAVKMRRLYSKHTLKEKIRRKSLDDRDLSLLCDTLADFYDAAGTSEKISRFGSWDVVKKNWEENFEQTRPFAENLLDPDRFKIIHHSVMSFLTRKKSLFNKRVKENKIRDCHGDLRAEHIYFSDGVQILDCIEFNERFRYSDITADLAFLAMDLDFLEASKKAHKLFELYMEKSPDPDLYVLLEFYKCYRAFVRCKVNCFQLDGQGFERFERERVLRETRKYFQLAYSYAVNFTRPTLWVICGVAASGKSTIARGLSDALGPEVIRSDEVRKKLFHIEPGTSVEANFQEGIYSRAASSLVYGKLLLDAQEILERGRSVILDATFSKRNHREEAARLARDMDSNLLFVHCRAPVGTLKKRLLKREQSPGVSDARVRHLKDLLDSFEPFDDVGGQLYFSVDTSGSVEDCLEKILCWKYVGGDGDGDG